MGKTVLIAEKPDQARSFYLPLLEKISGERFEKKNGYFESKSFFLTWFFGHLLEQLKPDEYNEKYKKWKIEDLPIIPDKMVYKYKGSGQKKQGQLILELCQKSDEIICGTDPDREGQGIFDTFAKYYKLSKPTKRLWATSLTEKDLLKAWSKMKEMKEYHPLSAARELRADSDWLVGMNASRAYSIVGKGNLPIGRVLTATLALIVKRDLEVENYKESFYYQLKGKWGGIYFTYFDDNGTKFEDRAVLERVKRECEQKAFSLTKFKSEEKIENPPKTFNLPDLQKEANKKYGFSLNKTLEIAQSLYEKKMTTYPRTDSPYLPESDLAEYHQLVRRIATSEEKLLLRPAGEKPACVKDTESPHTALVVTGEKASMSQDESKLYELVRSWFVCAFMIPRRYQQYEIEIGEGTGKKFKAIVNQDIDSGFRSIYQNEEIDEEIQSSSKKIEEADLRKTDGRIEALAVSQARRTKPKHYTPASLITAMQNCGRTLESESARKVLSEIKGIGTPATQALYPPQLLKYQYICEQSGFFVSTEKGRKLIEVISPDLKTPELTADWEMKLKLVERGSLSEDSYKRDLRDYVKRIVNEAIERKGKIDLSASANTEYECPQCGKLIVKKKWGYACDACSFSAGFIIAGKTIPEKELEKLLTTGETGLIKGFKSKGAGNSFEARLVIRDENGKKKVTFQFDNTVCPKCSKGNIRFFEWGAACSDRQGCSFKVSREIGLKKLSETQLIKLITRGATEAISGFKSKERKEEFTARLILDKEFNVKFDFTK